MAAVGEYDKISHSLAHYFEKRLCNKGDVLRCEPRGYLFEFDGRTASPVLRHEASDVRVCAHAVDLVERVDRRTPPEPARIVYVYAPAVAFCRAAELAHRDPHGAWRVLVKEQALRRADGGDDEAAWHGTATMLEPGAVARLQERDETRREVRPWHSEAFCLALHLPSRLCRPAAGTAACEQALELCLPDPAARAPEAPPGTLLVQAALRRDENAVRSLLHSKAHPDSRDSRGWTALHAACSVRPRWEVLRQLLRVCDVTARTRTGELPCDIADAHFYGDVAVALKEKMQQHKHAKHLPQATSTLSAAAREMLGLTQLDHQAASQKGRRVSDANATDLLQVFAVALAQKYSSSDVAFKAFDINSNGMLSSSEFLQYAKLLDFSGDVTAVFKALDIDRLGDVSVSEFSVLQQWMTT